MDFQKKKLIVIAFLWIFAPISWILMWKDKRFHEWFPPLLFVNGIIFTFVFVTQGFINFPKIDYLYQKYQIHEVPYFTVLTALLLTTFTVYQVILGIYLKGKLKTNKHVADDYIKAIMIIFTVDFFFGVTTGLLNVILPIGKLKMLL